MSRTVDERRTKFESASPQSCVYCNVNSCELVGGGGAEYPWRDAGGGWLGGMSPLGVVPHGFYQVSRVEIRLTQGKNVDFQVQNWVIECRIRLATLQTIFDLCIPKKDFAKPLSKL